MTKGPDASTLQHLKSHLCCVVDVQFLFFLSFCISGLMTGLDFKCKLNAAQTLRQSGEDDIGLLLILTLVKIREDRDGDRLTARRSKL